MHDIHTFHIPVMGTSFTIDTPIKVAQYGISSVISLVDDTLIEQMREFYCEQMDLAYEPIRKTDEDHRARRITAYLNLVDDIVAMKFAAVKNSEFEPGSEITKYFELLDDASPLKKAYLKMLTQTDPEEKARIQKDLRSWMRPGRIDVNIMTKLDRVNYQGQKELPPEYSDALSALRGFAKSKLESAIVFSAGLNRQLYSYVEKFEDFYANAKGFIKKKIILKVSDYRSSLIQGKFFAKKGLWVSEYRVESGLNCGGHAFPSKGFLIGPILDEFKRKRDELIAVIHKTYNKALSEKDRKVFEEPPTTRFTAQGGIGSAYENKLLFDAYKVNATGWGTAFLLVPEAVSVDEVTLQKLCAAGPEDLFLSDVSPIGAPFNNLKNAASELKKKERIAEGKPGSPCPKGHLTFNTEFTELPICVASQQYQSRKIAHLKTLDLPAEEFEKAYKKVTEKACICHDLGGCAVLTHKILPDTSNVYPAICPGPSIAEFSSVVSLSDMVDHIYGRANLLNKTANHNMFIKDLQMTIDHFIREVLQCSCKPSVKQIAALNEIKKNILDGIEYYHQFIPKLLQDSHDYKEKMLVELQKISEKVDTFMARHAHIFEISAT